MMLTAMLPHFQLLCCVCRRIQDFEDLLQKHDRVLGVVEAEAKEVAARFGRDRRTLVSADTGVCHRPRACTCFASSAWQILSTDSAAKLICV